MSNIPDYFSKLNFNRYKIEIRLKENLHFRFFHGYKLYDFLCKAIGFNVTRLGEHIIIDPAESGRINYKKGDHYRFGITRFNPPENFHEFLEARLKKLGDFNSKNDSLWGKYELVSITEMFDEVPQFPEFTEKIDLIFTTPLRMLRSDSDKKPGRKFFDCSFFDFRQFCFLLAKRISTLTNDTSLKSAIAENIPSKSEYDFQYRHFMWCDMSYLETTIGGIIGKISIRGNFNKELLALLWAGQTVMAGNNTSHGFGKYRIISPGGLDLKDILPAESFLQKMLRPQILLNSLGVVKGKITSAVNDQDRGNTYYLKKAENDLKITENNINNYSAYIEKFSSGLYEPGPLNGFFITKPGSETKKRALAIPSIEDRVLQRAASDTMYDVVEHFLDDFSFAYRKGFSRKTAAEAIKRYYEKGFKYYIKTDISSFFDSVDWKILTDKLETLFYKDPIVALILKWIKQDVTYNKRTVKRSMGLPQGMAISPLLANLFLDEFDRMLQGNFKLIRYSDDLVIMCKSKKAAEDAIENTKKTLEKLRLNLNDEKTMVSNVESGLNYLGYLFIESEVMERRKDHDYGVSAVDMFSSKNSWLSEIETNVIESYNAEAPKVFEVYSNSGAVNEMVRPVYITGQYKAVISSNFLVISSFSESKDTIKVPLNTISSVCFLGSPASSLHTILKLNELNKPVYFLRRNGDIHSASGSKPDYSLWMKQLELRNNTAFTLKFAKKIVSAKITNSKVLSKRYKWHQDIIDEYNTCLYALRKADTIEKIMGFEGAAAKIFFGAMKAAIPVEWKFTGRVKHPPVDPVNAMLSFGYTILYKHISSAIYMNGLNPEIGIYHSLKKGHNALASDLVEEFRFIIDSVVLYMIHRNMVNTSQFDIDEDSKIVCTMKTDFVKKFIAIIEERLRHQHKLEGFENTFLGSFYDKAGIILNIVKGSSEDYKPTLIRF